MLEISSVGVEDIPQEVLKLIFPPKKKQQKKGKIFEDISDSETLDLSSIPEKLANTLLPFQLQFVQ